MANHELQFNDSASQERDVFLEALLLETAEEQKAFLDRTCRNDLQLRTAVESLLKHHQRDAFLERPAPGAHVPERFNKTYLEAREGDRIGRYKILQKIGEGGCGTVYMAEQEEPVRRRVALKIIKLGMDTKQVIARFEAERQALAMMDHPNIARVLDGGATESGRPYFVMELVQGVRITAYCDENYLSTKERLHLFVQVCHAIQHAHHKGVIHRDIKPSNILVATHDGVPVPKVIDFGVVKAIEQPLTDKTLFTQFQTFIGTPAYTSPEQAEIGLDIDTRSDIYSLGVLLYELLTGHTPFAAEQLLKSNLDEMRRIIREAEPQRPSTRINGLDMTEATVLTGTRRVKVAALVQAFRGDLDWIVMKCLEKDRGRRYETANALALDVKRHLDNEPVLARRPSTGYRIQKFIRRNKVTVGSGIVVGFVLVLGTIISCWQAIRATKAEQEQTHLRRAVEAALKNEARLRQQAQLEKLEAQRRAYTSDMNLVQQALAANNYGRVMDLLDRHRPVLNPVARSPGSPEPVDFRQWEWRYFWAQSQSEAQTTLPPQSGPVTVLALSPNGRLLVAGSPFGQIKLWDLSTGTELATVHNGHFRLGSLAFSHDGGRVGFVSAGTARESTLSIWNVASRQTIDQWPVEGNVDLMAFSSDDRRILTFGQGNLIRVWNLENHELATEVQASIPGWGFRRPQFSPDGRKIGLIDRNRIHVMEVASGVEQCITPALEGGIASLAFSPDGELMAAGPSFSGTDTAVHLFSTRTGKELGQFVGHLSWVPDLSFTADGKELVSAGADQTLRIWDVVKQKEIANLRGHHSEIYRVTASPNGKRVVTGCKDGTILVWDCEHLATKSPFEILPTRVTSITFFPDSRHFLSLNQDHSMSLWNPDPLEELERLPNLRSRVDQLLISPDGSRVFLGTVDGNVAVFDWATRLVITNLALFPDGKRPSGRWPETGLIGFADRGRSLVVSAPGPSIRLFDTSSWECRSEWRAPTDLFSYDGLHLPVLSPDQHSLIFWQHTDSAEIRNLGTGEPEGTIGMQHQHPSGMAFSPDGNLFVTSSTDGTVNLWDYPHRHLIDVLRGHLLGVESVAFSPDGQRLASTSHGNEAVKLWDVITRHEVATLAGEGSLFRQVSFSPDGRLLVGINLQGQAHFWRAPSLETISARSVAASSARN